MKEKYEKTKLELLLNIDKLVPDLDDMEKHVDYIRTLLKKWDTETVGIIFSRNIRFFNRIMRERHPDILDEQNTILKQRINIWMKELTDTRYQSIVVYFLQINDELKKTPQNLDQIEKIKIKIREPIKQRTYFKKYDSNNEEREKNIKKWADTFKIYTVVDQLVEQ